MKVLKWLGIGVAMIVLLGVCSALAGDDSGTTEAARPDREGEVGSDQPAAPAAAPVVLLELTGSGTKSSQTFSAKGDWDLEWTYDCSKFGYDGNFIVSTDGFTALGVNQLGANGNGVEHYHGGGTGHIEVISSCDWTVKAVAV